jgi:hypothetical protein
VPDGQTEGRAVAVLAEVAQRHGDTALGDGVVVRDEWTRGRSRGVLGSSALLREQRRDIGAYLGEHPAAGQSLAVRPTIRGTKNCPLASQRIFRRVDTQRGGGRVPLPPSLVV